MGDDNMKPICVPVITEKCDRSVIKHENTPVAIIQNSSALFSGNDGVCGKIGRFYSALEEKIGLWIDKDFGEYAKSKYISDPSPRKKYRYLPLELTKDMTSDINEADNRLRVCIHITLKVRNSLIAERSIVHIWDLKNGFLYVPKKHKAKKRSN